MLADVVMAIIHDGSNIKLLPPEATQRPVCLITLHTSCFKLIFAAQQVPVETGRPAFWGLGAAKRAGKTWVNALELIIVHALVTRS